MWLRRIGYAVSGLAVLYAAATASLYTAMCQPPERFGAIMSHVPMITMMILPFEPLWMSARKGSLAVGDAAPDFVLPVVDHSSKVKLSEQWPQRPVVLIFGSYT